MSKKAPTPPPQVVLPAPHAIKLWFDDREPEEYLPVDVLFQHDKNTGVALVTWNKPDQLNPLTRVSNQETLFILEHCKQDPEVRAVVLTGAGRAFSAGASIKDRQGEAPVWPEYVKEAYMKKDMWDMESLFHFSMAFWHFPKILIAAVNGMAVGGSANVVLANFHDFVICSEAAKFKYPFVTLGITPELGSSAYLPFAMGMARAKEVLLGGEWFSGHDAVKWGLANKVVPATELLPSALQMASYYGAIKSQTALYAAKELVNRHRRKDIRAVLTEENVELKNLLMVADSPLGRAYRAKL